MGGDPPGHLPGAQAGEQHGGEGEHRRPHKNPGIGRSHHRDAVQIPNHHGGQGTARQPSQKQAYGNTCRSQQQRLVTQDAAQLPGRGTNGFQKAVKSDIPATEIWNTL